MGALHTLYAAGIALRADGGTLKASGRLTDEHRQLIRAHKAELLALLAANAEPAAEAGAPHRRWRLYYPGGRTVEVDSMPPCAHPEILECEPPDTTATPIPEPQGGRLPAADEELIRAVCAAWSADSGEIRDAIAEAAADPSLMASWRQDASKLGLGADAFDERITCYQCRLVTDAGLCENGDFGLYHPPTDRPQRCWAFLPHPGAADQRSGTQRWPGLKEQEIAP